MNMWLLVFILLILAIVSVPGGPIRHDYGYGPSYAVVVAIVILVALILAGRL